MKNNEFLNLFLDETEENLDRLATGLVALEKTPNDSLLINDVFRDAHTIKGSAGAMGFEQMAKVAHHMESLLSLLRENQLDPKAELFSVLLSALDLLKNIKQVVYLTGKEGQHDLTKVIAALEVFSPAEFGKIIALQQKVETSATAPQSSPRSTLYKIDIVLRPDTIMKGVRAFILLQSLREFGVIEKCTPREELLLNENFDQRFTVEFSTERPSEAVVAQLAEDGDVEDVKSVSVASMQTENQGIEKATAKTEVRQHSVRVDVRKLEVLMNLVGELVIERNRLANVTGHLERQNKEDENVRGLITVSTQLGRITGNLQREIMKVRMVPIAQLFGAFPRLVRDLSQNLDKNIELILEGTETEIDRTIVEEIRDPLIHLVRNSVDHGIETVAERALKQKPVLGRIVLSARHEDNHVVISVKDDGGGIDNEAVARKAMAMGLVTANDIAAMSDLQRQRLIMLPGLSTATSVSAVSGRGVGMDIVSSHIEKIGGSIEIDSQSGRGTEFTIRLPLTLAVFRALLVRANNSDYAVAIATVIEARKLNPADVRVVQGQDCLVLRDQIVPVVPLYSLLELSPPEKRPNNLVIITSGATKVGILVDRLIGEQEIVIKPLGPFFSNNKEFAGATILGDGRVVPILDVNGLLGLLQRQ